MICAASVVPAAPNTGERPQVCNHGISQKEVDEAFGLNEKFFALERQKKEEFGGDKSNKSYILGYSAEAHTGEP